MTGCILYVMLRVATEPTSPKLQPHSTAVHAYACAHAHACMRACTMLASV
jgi:hypothetical protein